MKIYYFFLLSFLLVSTTAKSQYESLVNKPHKERYKEFNEALDNSKKTKTYKEVLAFSKKITALGKKHNDKALELEGEFYAAFYYLASGRFDEKKAVKDIEVVIKKAEEQNVLSLQIRATNTLGHYFWNARQQYRRGFRYYIKTHELLQKTNATDFPEWVDFYNTIANSYYAFRDFKTAIFYTKQNTTIPITKKNWTGIWSSNNNIGVYYEKLNKLDSAKYYYEKALENPFLQENDIRYTTSKGNIGDLYFYEGKYNKAYPLLIKSFENAKRYKDYRLASSVALRLVDIYTIQERYTKVELLLAFVEKHLNRTIDYHSLSKYYRAKSNYFFDRKEVALGRKYNDSMVYALKKKNETFNSIILLRAQEAENSHKIEVKNAEFAFAKQEYKNKMIGISIISTLVILFLLVIFFIIRKKYRIEQELHQKEIEEADTAIKKFKKRIEEDSGVIDKLKQLKTDESNTKIIEKIQKKYTLKNDDWDEFFTAFQILHKGYIDRLKTIVPNITRNEIRVVSLARLELENKDIATVLSVTPQAIRTTWYRLSKKIALKKEENLLHFIMEI